MNAAALPIIIMLATAATAEEPRYRQQSATLDERLADLLGRMTIDEKIAQLTQQSLWDAKIVDGAVDRGALDKLFGGIGTGTIECPIGGAAADVSLRVQATQDYFATNTRLGIPAIAISECIHGVLARGATIFPQALAQGCTWNPALIEAMGQAIGREASAIGVTQCLSPLFDLARDPRYGRVEECYGECPYLVSRMGVAFVLGVQGTDFWERGLGADNLMCTAKHFAGYSVPHGGINIAPASIGQREMRSLHLVPFEAAVREAGICAVMPSYNEVDGLPSHANRWLLTQVLRDEWGFRGYVYSDYGAIDMLHSYQHVAPDVDAAGARALTSGVDFEAPGINGLKNLAAQVAAGKVPLASVDRAVERVLRMKFRAGLFDGRRARKPDDLSARLRTPEHVALARRIAEESVVLLKNDGRLLPLDIAKVRSIAVIGPSSDQVQFGDYSATKSNTDGVTVLAALREAAGDSVTLHYAKGCELFGSSRAGFDEAVDAARRCDVAIVVIGDTSMVLGDTSVGDKAFNQLATVGEGFDVTDPNPPGVQTELVRAIHATGKPVIVIMIQGRPYCISWMKQNIPALMSAVFPGEQGGRAIADILLGRVNPSGRLSMSWPQSAGHIPTVYDYLPCGRGVYNQRGTADKPGRDYVHGSPDPLFAFGFGLSYTTFEYADLQIETPTVALDGVVRLSFSVRNTGTRSGKEVAQMYVRDVISSTTTPMMRLHGFRKITLDAGSSERPSFEIAASALSLWNEAMQRVVEPGEFEVMIAASAEDIRLRGTFRVQ